ncbi:hypothetical protein [Modestobacter sp. VKM Ac-2978]|uniref:hypothetical protein n=1 Tax=Modestobacter sp. VKM Ac-2978 TaxID=3004132 RepID=UPI0022AA9498|nr:hypothetical protein [Modestobacter sp. VKM Ac-2978]MCZ2847271.1 hypothetical protein [Modestobacter sp. VKM Ac-2978]
MGRAAALSGRVLAGGVLAGGVLAGCGTGGTASRDVLDVSLDGFVAVAERPTPATLCDPDPTATASTPPGLPAGLGDPEAAYLQSAPTTVEAYLWTAEDADAAQTLVSEATVAASACTWTVTQDLDLDGDGVTETPGAHAQQVEQWSTDDWSGTRIVRTVPGAEQVDRRLVSDGAVVLLVVTRTDGDDPALLTPADDYLDAVAERLA